MLPRGIRNNNPLNIRRGKDQWQGLRAQQTDASFCQFESLDYGWRAAFYLLTRTYYHKYRLYTIRMIISKWAPPQENLTATYIENVCRLTGIPPDEPIGIPEQGFPLIYNYVALIKIQLSSVSLQSLRTSLYYHKNPNIQFHGMNFQYIPYEPSN